MTEEEILSSNVFRLLNWMIEREAKVIQRCVSFGVERAAKIQADLLPLRSISYERGRHFEGADILECEAERLAGNMREALEARRRISDYQRIKLRLLNDVDFHDPDFELRRAIFGDGPTPIDAKP